MAVSEKVELLLREERSQEVEWDSVSDELRCTSVDVVDTYEREVLVAWLRWLDFSCNSVTCLESVLLDLILRYVDIVR